MCIIFHEDIEINIFKLGAGSTGKRARDDGLHVSFAVAFGREEQVTAASGRAAEEGFGIEIAERFGAFPFAFILFGVGDMIPIGEERIPRYGGHSDNKLGERVIGDTGSEPAEIIPSFGAFVEPLVFPDSEGAGILAAVELGGGGICLCTIGVHGGDTFSDQMIFLDKEQFIGRPLRVVLGDEERSGE